MPNQNKVIITGHLGRDPEKRITSGGKPYAFFSVAVTEKWTDKSGEKQENTQWIPFISWGKSSEVFCSNFKKGDAVEIAGKVRIKKKDEGYDEVQLEALFFNRPIYKVLESRQEELRSFDKPEYNNGSFDDNTDDLPF